jgi:hypothetical protein
LLVTARLECDAPFDEDPAPRHNAAVIRLALAAILFCSTLLVAAGQTPSGLPALDETAVTAATRDCTAADDAGEWRPQPQVPASLSESVGKWRTLDCGRSDAHRSGTDAALVPVAARVSLASAAPSYLLHTPLLI